MPNHERGADQTPVAVGGGMMAPIGAANGVLDRGDRPNDHFANRHAADDGFATAVFERLGSDRASAEEQGG